MLHFISLRPIMLPCQAGAAVSRKSRTIRAFNANGAAAVYSIPSLVLDHLSEVVEYLSPFDLRSAILDYSPYNGEQP